MTVFQRLGIARLRIVGLKAYMYMYKPLLNSNDVDMPLLSPLLCYHACTIYN